MLPRNDDKGIGGGIDNVNRHTSGTSRCYADGWRWPAGSPPSARLSGVRVARPDFLVLVPFPFFKLTAVQVVFPRVSARFLYIQVQHQISSGIKIARNRG